MATFDDKDQERLSEANKASFDRINTLGSVADLKSEPFRRVQNSILTEMWQRTPDDSAGLITPEFDDDPCEGSVGTRFIEQRLHSYLPSGLNGSESVQTFFLVDNPPSFHDINDIDGYRVTPLIPPTFSVNKADAYEVSGNIRGFQLALFPAMSNGGVGSTLMADTSNGSIPVSADPGAGPPDDFVPGAGDIGYWTVDYENGIVRFSRPPLNGADGVMNPNDVFGDISGVETGPDGYGAITMFATYYKYTGEFGTLDNLSFVTVGDGYISNGTFEGSNQNVVQSAVNSLSITSGGVVFIKEGVYDFEAAVTIPGKVKVMGMKGSKIIRPSHSPAFIINDGYSEIECLDIVKPTDVTVISSGAIELRNTSAGQVIENVVIKNNIIPGFVGIPAIAFGPSFNCTYNNLTIEGNTFKQGAPGVVTYIGENVVSGVVTLNSFSVFKNAFDPGNADLPLQNSILLTANGIGDIDGLNISNNGSTTGTISVINNGQFTDVTCSNNNARNITIDAGGGDLQECIISNNVVLSNILMSANDGTSSLFSCMVSNNTADNITVSYDSANNILISDNNIATTLFVTGTGTSTPGKFAINGNLVEGLFTCSGNTDLTDFTIVGNFFDGTVTLEALDNSLFGSNNVSSNVNIDSGAASGTIILRSAVTNNMITGTLTIGAGTSSTSQTFVGDISGNHMAAGGDIIHSGAVTSGTIVGNTTGDLTFGDLSSVRLCSNLGNVTAGDVSDSTYSDNRGAMTINSMDQSSMSGNRFNGTTVVTTTVSESSISGNTLGNASPFTITGAVTNTSISANSFWNDINLGSTIDNSTISANYIASNIEITGAVTSTNINGNTIKFGDLLLNSTVANSTMNNNIVNDVTFSSAVSNSVFAGNIVLGDLGLITGAHDTLDFSTNKISGTITGSTITPALDITTSSAAQLTGSGGSGALLAKSGVGLFVAVGDAGEVQTSSDGITWEQQTAAFGGNGVGHDGCGLWVAVGSTFTFETSPDGINWTTRPIFDAGLPNMNDVAHDQDGLWVAVGASATIYTSLNGFDWDKRTADAGYSNEFHSVAHDGVGLWTVVGTAGEIQTSIDGINWLRKLSNTNSNLTTVGHNKEGLRNKVGSWVVAGDSGTIRTSDDGYNWLPRPGNNVFFDGLAYDGYSMWVGVGSSGNIQVSGDNNGTSWQAAVPGAGGGFGSFFEGVAHDGYNVFVAVGASGEIQSSQDGYNWIQRTAAGGYSSSFRAVSFGTLPAIFAEGVGSAPGIIAKSSGNNSPAILSLGPLRIKNDFGITTDVGDFLATIGVANLTEGASALSNATMDIAHDGFGQLVGEGGGDHKGVWVAVHNSAGEIQSSMDGKIWTSRTADGASPGTYLGIGSNNGKFVICGTGGDVQTSINGTNWSKRSLNGYSSFLYEVTHDGQDTWVMVGNNDGGFDGIWTSTNAETWVARTADGSPAAGFRTVATDKKGKWIIGGANGEVQESTDNGVTWTSITPILDIVTNLIALIRHDGRNTWVLDPNNSTGQFYISNDGTHWRNTVYTDGKSSNAGLVHDGNGMWMATTGGGNVLWVSLDGAETWRPLPVVLEPGTMNTVASDKRGRVVIGDNGGNLYYSLRVPILR